MRPIFSNRAVLFSHDCHDRPCYAAFPVADSHLVVRGGELIQLEKSQSMEEPTGSLAPDPDVPLGHPTGGLSAFGGILPGLLPYHLECTRNMDPRLKNAHSMNRHNLFHLLVHKYFVYFLYLQNATLELTL